MKKCIFTLAAFVVALCMTAVGQGQIIPFDLAGNAGIGLLPGNEPPPGSVSSSASGGETGAGFSYDTANQTLDFAFDFQGLSGGLRDAAGGIHFHLPGTPGDPFNNSGGIAFFLNNGADANVSLSTPQIAIGSTSGSLAGTVSFANSTDLIDDLLAGELYLNIHSETFPGGELRGTLVPIPEPTAAALALVGLALFGVSRNR